MANQPQRKPVPLTPLDVLSNWLFASPTAGATKRPSLRLRMMGNVPRFQVKTNVPDDKDYGRIEFNTDLDTFIVAMTFLKRLGEGTEEGTYNIEYNDHVFTNGQRSEHPVTKATLKIGKDRDSGKIFIAVLGYQRPKIQFFFGPSQFHAVKAGDNSELDAGWISRQYAMAYAERAMSLMYPLLVQGFDEDAKNVPKPQGPPQGQGGNGGGGGYQQPTPQPSAPAPSASSFDEEFGSGW